MTIGVDEFRALPSGTLRLRVWNRRTDDLPQLNVPIVLVHGLGGSVLDWELLAPLLASKARVIAFDMPGFGRSAAPVDKAGGIEAQVRALAEVIDSEGGFAHIIGNSLGALAAAQLAAFAPESVRTLTLLSPAFPDRSPRIRHLPMVALASPGIGTEMFKMVQAMPVDKQVESKVSISFGSGVEPPTEWVSETEQLLVELRDSEYLASAYAECANDLLKAAFDSGPDRPWALAGRLTVPVLVTHSGRDRLVRPELRHKWASVLPSSRRVLFTNAGHVPQLSAPESVANVWLRFVASV
jgi:pimeloyl-ACP methyl ester carboxylesterase